MHVIIQHLLPGITAVSRDKHAGACAGINGRDQHIRVRRVHKQAGDDPAAEPVTFIKHRPGLAAVIAA